MTEKGWKVIARNDKDVKTRIYDFKTSKGVNDKSLNEMFDTQICNHLLGAYHITTKCGLT